MSTQLQALKAFVDTEQNPDLLRLEALLKRFNLFEAVGVVRHELRHSDFLAFLLDPNQTHGLGAAFLNAFLKAVYQSSASSALSSDFDDSSQAYVQREWHHVDILVIGRSGLPDETIWVSSKIPFPRLSIKFNPKLLPTCRLSYLMCQRL